MPICYSGLLAVMIHQRRVTIGRDGVAGTEQGWSGRGSVCWEKGAWEPVPLGAARSRAHPHLGTGVLEDSSNNSEPGCRAEGPWKVPSLVLSPLSPHNGRPLHRCGDGCSRRPAREWQRPQSAIPSPACHTRLIHPPGVLGTGGLALPVDGQRGPNTSDSENGRKKRGKQGVGGREREERQVVLKWETEQMFLGSCELTRQTTDAADKLVGRGPAPPCPPAFLWYHLGPGS